MYKVIGFNEKDIASAETFTKALRILCEHCSEPLSQITKQQNLEKKCYIEAVGETASARMYYPYVFEFAVKAGLIKNGKFVEPMIEPATTELIAAFSRVAILQFTSGMGCH
jgi:hypothetical protein